MAWHDIFSSHRDVSKELAEHEVYSWDLEHEQITSMEQFDEYVKCSTEYIQEKYPKGLIVEYLDKFFRG